MDGGVESYNTSLHLNPLGNLHVEVEIDLSNRKFDNDVLILHRGGYAYDYQTFRGILWPLSSKVRDITAKIDTAYAITKQSNRIELSPEHREAKTGGDMLAIPLSKLENDQEPSLCIEFIVTNLINRDIIFHEMVYALTPPEIYEDSSQGLKLNERLSIDDLSVESSIHFAYGIRSSSLHAEKYDLETGSSITDDSYRDKLPTHGTAENQIVFADRDGDVVNSRWEGSLGADEELDLHIQGSHLPFLARISRPAFWTGIWLVILILFITLTVLPKV